MMKVVFSKDKTLILILAFASLMLPFGAPLVHAQSGGQLSDRQIELLKSGVYYFDMEPTRFTSCTPGGAGGGGELAAVPEVWRSLILNAAQKYPDADARLVAAVLWVENGGWPAYRKDNWPISPADGRGPWQFIPQTWFGWDTGITSWERMNDPSAYSASGMGRDGDGDGIKDPDNPADAVEAAFVHMKDSVGKPIMNGFSGDVQAGYNDLVFRRDGTNLLSYAANYNGKGAPNNTRLSSFGHNENSHYVIAAYWILASDFREAWSLYADSDHHPPNNLVDPTIHNNHTEQSDPSLVAATSCQAAVSVDGYAFPIKATKQNIRSYKRLPCLDGPNGCHHDDTPAFDLFIDTDGDPSDLTENIGVPVYAISDGKIETTRDNYKGFPNCYTVQFLSDDEYYYGYLHISNPIVSPGQTVRAGERIAEIGRTECTGNNSIPHLHIDRGSPKGHFGGSPTNRDAGIIDIINNTFEDLPDEI